MNIAPLHVQVISMVKELEAAASKSQRQAIFFNYLNLYRDEYLRAKSIFEREYRQYEEATK
jgi:hypothetical protein